MDMKPVMLPLDELQLRKARDLIDRGYDAPAITAAMGLRSDRVDALLRDLTARDAPAAAEPHGGG